MVEAVGGVKDATAGEDIAEIAEGEILEAEEEIAEDEGAEGVLLEELEGGKGKAVLVSPDLNRWTEGARNFCSLFLGPVFVQAFVLTFLGEWGDRSQISTTALAASHNVYLVTMGTILGHSLCTALAVIGGRYVSTKISAKHLTYGGSMLFLVFGIIYLHGALAAHTDVITLT